MGEFELIVKIVKIIDMAYNVVCDWWDENNKYRYNQRNNNVVYVGENSQIYNNACEYLDFLNSETIQELLQLFNKSSIIDRVRVKTINSMLDKIERYKNRPEKGHVAINKCLNDLFGLRIITKRNHNFLEIKQAMENLPSKFVCEEVCKNGYRAIHIYFAKDNFHYRWELQLWYKNDEQNNYESHKLHKQKYTKNEKEIFNQSQIEEV